jgi:hypothetical protein
VEFDPTDHSVAEVKAHLEANPDDLDRVLELEKAGKNRQGIVSLGGDDAEAATPTVPRGRGDAQYIMAEAAKLLNQGEGQEPFKRQDD